MFNLGSRVKHKNTDDVGIVTGYGYRIVKNKCLKTLKVKIISPNQNRKKTLKDLDCQWLSCAEDYRLINPNPLARHLIAKPLKISNNYAQYAQSV
ncbi:MAG: hypothetical protein AAGF83_18990 [Cyanobacteria bacterium P01_G01_bin.67]